MDGVHPSVEDPSGRVVRADPDLEYRVKAAFLFHFVRTTTWPRDAFQDDAAVLLVGENDGFAERGAHANFYFERNRLRFEINARATRESGLGVSSELLKLARIVETRG